jgi:hypothetical protein
LRSKTRGICSAPQSGPEEPSRSRFMMRMMDRASSRATFSTRLSFPWSSCRSRSRTRVSTLRIFSGSFSGSNSRISSWRGPCHCGNFNSPSLIKNLSVSDLRRTVPRRDRVERKSTLRAQSSHSQSWAQSCDRGRCHFLIHLERKRLSRYLPADKSYYQRKDTPVNISLRKPLLSCRFIGRIVSTESWILSLVGHEQTEESFRPSFPGLPPSPTCQTNPERPRRSLPGEHPAQYTWRQSDDADHQNLLLRGALL